MLKKWTNSVKNRLEIPILVVLASESPRRKMMLSELRIPFKSFHPRIDESLRLANPVTAARELAVRKVKAFDKKNSLVIGMDTLVVIGKEQLGKPCDANDARRMLKKLSAKKHRVITGVAISFQNRIVSTYESTNVYFRKLQSKEIDWYISTGESYGKAGSYAIQGLGRLFIPKIEGCYYNVLGFPVGAFLRTLTRLNISYYDLRKTLDENC